MSGRLAAKDRDQLISWQAPDHVAGVAITFAGDVASGDRFYVLPGELVREGDDWWLGCPCGSGGVLDGHTVESTDPVTVSPSIVCPAGCHYWIKGGLTQ